MQTIQIKPIEPIIVLEPGRNEHNYWSDLWRYRELFVILAWRDVAVRYKQTAIGVAWAILKPFLTMVVFTIIFGNLAGLPSEGQAPYALMVLAGMLPWTLFSSGLSEASNSLIGNEKLVSKVYFPRIIMPVATIVTALVDFLISMIILFLVMAYYRYSPSWNILLLPFFVTIALLSCLGPGLWITAMNVKYRDFRYVIPFLIQLSLYISPVGFSSSIIGEKWRWLYSLNPMVGVIDGFRWCIFGWGSSLYLPGFLLSLTIVGFFLWFGVSQFRKVERSFADLI
jgi:lipopolysaccharide transport system permease protein